MLEVVQELAHFDTLCPLDNSLKGCNENRVLWPPHYRSGFSMMKAERKPRS